MTYYGLQDVAFVLIDGVDIGSGIVYSLNDEIAQRVEEVTAAGHLVKREDYGGYADCQVTMEAFWDHIINDTLVTLRNTAVHVLSYSLEGNIQGRHAENTNEVTVQNHQRLMKLGELHKTNLQLQAQGYGLEQGINQLAFASYGPGANPTTQGVDGVSQTTYGCRIWAHITALTLGGYTNVGFKLQDSTTDGSYVDVASGAIFTAKTTAPQFVCVDVPGTIRRWTKVAITFTGAGSGNSVSGFVAMRRKTAAG